MKTQSLSVVIIDDDPAMVGLVTRCLRGSGCCLNGTSKPKEGVALVHKINPDVILCDAEMSGMSGAQIIETLKSDSATASIPVILITGFAGPEMFSHVQWTGFLSKPFSQSELIAALHHAVAAAASISAKQPVDDCGAPSSSAGPSHAVAT